MALGYELMESSESLVLSLAAASADKDNMDLQRHLFTVVLTLASSLCNKNP